MHFLVSLYQYNLLLSVLVKAWSVPVAAICFYFYLVVKLVSLTL